MGVLGYCDTTISGSEMCRSYFLALSSLFRKRLKYDQHISLSEIVVSQYLRTSIPRYGKCNSATSPSHCPIDAATLSIAFVREYPNWPRFAIARIWPKMFQISVMRQIPTSLLMSSDSLVMVHSSNAGHLSYNKQLHGSLWSKMRRRRWSTHIVNANFSRNKE